METQQQRGAMQRAFSRARGLAAALAMAAGLAACGGGGGGGQSSDGGGGAGGPAAAPPTTAASAAAAPSDALVSLVSEAGDYIGQGGSRHYDTTNASIRLEDRGGFLRVRVNGAQSWTGEFLLPGSPGRLVAGTYTALGRYPFQDAAAGALSWTGEGRGCNVSSSTLVIRSASYSGGLLQAVDLSFEQHCDGSAAALKGDIRIDAAAMSRVSALRNAIPDRPVVSLSSDAGDYIGSGGVYGYNAASAGIEVQNSGTHLTVKVDGDEHWRGEFSLPTGVAQWQPGRWTGLTRQPFSDPAVGGIEWSGEGRGCNQLSGTLTVNAVRYEAGVLAAIDLDFEQHCEGGPAALRGHIAWDAQAPVPAPGPQAAMPAGLWSPSESQMPTGSRAMLLQSDYGDYIGQGWTWYVHTADSALPAGTPVDTSKAATVSVTEQAGLLTVKLSSEATNWTGEFKAMDGLTHLQPGYYGIVHRYPFQNPRRGGMAWRMDGRGCNTLAGWFAIDSISYVGDTLSAVDLRFTQYCDNALGALRGRVRWSAGDATTR